jgi:hypothetical protein
MQSFIYLSAHLAAMEGHLPCLKYIVSAHRDVTAILGARNDQGDTPKSVAVHIFMHSNGNKNIQNKQKVLKKKFNSIRN